MLESLSTAYIRSKESVLLELKLLSDMHLLCLMNCTKFTTMETQKVEYYCRF